MARNIRIEYKDAFYHVMARGNQRRPIFLDDEDRTNFLKTLDEVCEMTGWRVHAWVLMDNHYHLFIQTPEANLVEGMKWFQNTYTRRFNVRHREWGRLFGDRYKALLVEGGNNYYYETILDYIHLNPVRAGLIVPAHKQSVLDYPWSSLAQGYALPPSKCKKWLAYREGLKSYGLSDTKMGRCKMIDHLNQRAAAEASEQCGVPTLLDSADQRCSHLERGWYWGTIDFSKKIIALVKEGFGKQKSPAYRSAPQYKSHQLSQAKDWLHEGLRKANLTSSELMKLKGSDPRKVFLALFLRKKTTVSNIWLAEELKMKSAGNVSHLLNRININKLKKKLPLQLIEYVKSQGFEI